MKLNMMMPALRTAVKRAQLFAMQHAPELLAAGGAAVTVAGGVLACKATTHLPEVKAKAAEPLETIRQWREDPSLDPNYTDTQANAMTAKIYMVLAVDLIKLYAPAVLLAGCGIGAMLGGNYILRKRNLALAAAYTAIDASYKQYRARVVEKYGTDADRELRLGKKTEAVTTEYTDENGVTGTKTENADLPQPVKDPYLFWFGEGNRNWQKSPEYTEMFLTMQQQWATDKLRGDGWLCLNDVLYALGMERVAYGQEVGWVHDKHGEGDDFVDFGIYKDGDNYRAFENRQQPGIWLDFNVQGSITSLIEQFERT